MKKTARSALWLLALAACGKADAPPAAPAALPTFAPPSGGEMVLVPGSGALKSFYIDRTLVTQELYESVAGSNPSKRREKKNPVERVTWMDAVRFLNKCSERDGLSPCYNLETGECDFEADGYRLPTDAEWEHACRAGGKGAYAHGDDPAQLGRYAWYKANSGGQPRPVGQKLPNAWGLYDMQGNVWQWCNDWYGETPGRPPAKGEQRVLRGGAWDSPAEKLSVSFRLKEYPVFGDACFGADSYGFRRARSGEGKKKTVVGSAATAPPPAPPSPPAPPVAPVQESGAFKADSLKGTIVFVSDRGGALDLWKMRASGKDAKPLTNDAHADADPRFSPDGKSILYTTVRGGFPEVWVMNRDGSGARKITEGSQGDWSPDGKSIAFIRDNQAFVRELAAGRDRRVTPEGWERCGTPAWSPDGKRIAVASRHEKDVGIYLVGADGKGFEKLKTRDPACTPRWAGDGKRLLCQTTKGRVCQVELDGSNWEEVTFGNDIQHEGRYSPDGTMVLFCRSHAQTGPWQICVRRYDGEDDEFVQLTKEGSNLLPDWHASED